ncbi:MAG: hypothetical protein U1F43_10430 [Myxococcota bacterium]
MSARGSATVAADGAFVAAVLDPEPTHLALLGPDDDLVMIGQVSDGAGEISVATTAAALLYDAIGAASLPPEHARTLAALLADLPELDGDQNQRPREVRE